MKKAEYEKLLKDKKIERLTIKKIITRRGKLYAQCICDCGNKTEVRLGNLLSGSVKSCGCLRRERMQSRSDTYTRYPGETLCWSCTKSDCSWFTNFVPVDGWEAVRCDYATMHTGIVDSYTVIKCPLYDEFKR